MKLISRHSRLYNVANSPGFILCSRIPHRDDASAHGSHRHRLYKRGTVTLYEAQHGLTAAHLKRLVRSPSVYCTMIVGILTTLATLATLAASVPLEERQACSSVW